MKFLHLDLIIRPFWHFLGPKHVFCAQNYQLGPGDNVAQRATQSLSVAKKAPILRKILL